MKTTENKISAGARTRELGTQQYIVALDTTGRELTKPMSWQDAVAWVQSPMTKGAYPEGVVIIPASYPEQKEVA